MHELSLAGAIVQAGVEVAAREGAARVVSVRLGLGVLSCARAEALEHCFPLVARGTPLEGATLEIAPAPLVLRCGACGQTTERPTADVRCAACGATEVEILSGRDLIIDSMELAGTAPAQGRGGHHV